MSLDPRKISFRKARAEDFLKLAEADRLAWRKNSHSQFIPDGEHAWRLWCEYAVLYICENGKKEIIGCALAFPCEGEKLYAIHKVFVLEQFRGEGLGGELLSLLLEDIKNKKSQAFLTVDPANKGGISLYEKLGFKKEKLVEGYYRQEEDRYIMRFNGSK